MTDLFVRVRATMIENNNGLLNAGAKLKLTATESLWTFGISLLSIDLSYEYLPLL
jgi:hypothetical protein